MSLLRSDDTAAHKVIQPIVCFLLYFRYTINTSCTAIIKLHHQLGFIGVHRNIQVSMIGSHLNGIVFCYDMKFTITLKDIRASRSIDVFIYSLKKRIFDQREFAFFKSKSEVKVTKVVQPFYDICHTWLQYSISYFRKNNPIIVYSLYSIDCRNLAKSTFL